MNVLVAILISLRNVAAADAPDGPLALAFACLMLVGHAAFLVFLPALLPLALILVLPRPRLVRGVGIALGVSLAVVLLVDTVIFAQYRFHLHAEVWNILLGGAAGEILVFSTATYVEAFLGLLAITGCQMLLSRLVWARASRGRGWSLGRPLVALFVLAFVAQAALHAWADVSGYVPITRQGRVLFAYVPVTAEKQLVRLGFAVARPDRALLARHAGSALSYPRRPLVFDARSAVPPNVLLIVIDGWRFDALDERVTPHLFRFAERAVRFTDHLSGGSATRTGIFSLFYALPGTYWHAVLAERRGPLLVDELLRRGYELGIFASAKLVNPEFDRTVFAAVPDLRDRSDGDTPSARDADLTEDFLAFLDARDAGRPFFGFLFYDAPHAYDVPADFEKPFEPSLERVDYFALSPSFDPLPFHNLYRNCLRYDDGLIGRVLERLERDGLLEQTVVVVTGDHGQEFNENGLNFWGHDGNFSRFQVAVPLVVHWPGWEPAAYSHRTSHYDLVPTLFEELFACTSDPQDYGVGHHLLRPGGREALLLANYTDYAIVEAERIVAIHPYGVEVLDPRWRRIPGASADREALVAALELRSRFFK